MDALSSTRRPPPILMPMLLLCAALSPAAGHSQTVMAAPSDRATATVPRISGSLSLVSDYRFRGLSRTDIGPALQPFVQLDTRPGIFASAWASNVSSLNGATAEVDISAGWSGTIGAFNSSAGVIGYLYPGATRADTVELFGWIGLPIGPVTTSLGVNWSPDQANLGRSNRYAFAGLSAAMPGRPITLKANVGNERGGLVQDQTGRTTTKWDWQVGASYSASAVTLGVAYVGTDLPARDALGNRTNRLGQDGVVFSFSALF